MAIKPISVTQLNEYISRVVTTDPLLANIRVNGEISNLKFHGSGHVYFSIIDSQSKINCFLSKDYIEILNFQLREGMNVTITGSVNIFKKNGSYSLYVKDIEKLGEGDLNIAFIKLKEKLEKQGLFDKEHKLAIPDFPRKIGVITSETGAAVQDIIKTIRNKNSIVDMMIFPVLVQGDKAAEEISNMIDLVNDRFWGEVDTLIVGRGGGSIDDLWPFNDEKVARSIYHSQIPIISGIGHEIDFTIADLVADVRAETPTAAANIAVYDEKIILDKLEYFKNELSYHLNSTYSFYKMRCEASLLQLHDNMQGKLRDSETFIDKCKIFLESNNPTKILASGYGIIEDDNKQLVTTVKNIHDDKEYKLTLHDGSIKCRIIKIGSEIIDKR